MSRDVAIIDSGGSNISSVRFALQRLGIAPRFTGDWNVIRRATHVLLPGVGAAGAAMDRLQQLGLSERIGELVQPVLGICLGMQLLFQSSAEDDTACLGVIPAAVEPLTGGPGLTIPHMGWNRYHWAAGASGHPLTARTGSGDYGYFVHSYAAPVGPWTLAWTKHGCRFSSIVASGNFCGIQFHPERSGAVGQQLLANFLAIHAAGGIR